MKKKMHISNFGFQKRVDNGRKGAVHLHVALPNEKRVGVWWLPVREENRVMRFPQPLCAPGLCCTQLCAIWDLLIFPTQNCLLCS